MSPLLHQMSGQTWKASRACLDLIGSVLGSVLGSVRGSECGSVSGSV